MIRNSTRRVLHFLPDLLAPNNKPIMCVSSTDEGGAQRDRNTYGEQEPWDIFPKLPPRSQSGAPRQEHYYTRGLHQAWMQRKRSKCHTTLQPFKNENKGGKDYLGETMWHSRQKPHFPFKTPVSPQRKSSSSERCPLIKVKWQQTCNRRPTGASPNHQPATRAAPRFSKTTQQPLCPTEAKSLAKTAGELAAST